MNLKPLLYRELIFEKRFASILILILCSSQMLLKSPVYALSAYLYLSLIFISISKSADIPALGLLNVSRKNIVRSDVIATTIRQWVFLIIMSIMAVISVLAIPEFNSSDEPSLTTGITVFALLLLVLATSNVVLAPLKYHKSGIIQVGLLFFSILMVGVFIASCYLFSTNPTLAAIFNNNAIENIGAQLGLLFGGLALLILSTILGYVLTCKAISTMDMRIN